jgi:hypothetical protein
MVSVGEGVEVLEYESESVCDTCCDWDPVIVSETLSVVFDGDGVRDPP